MRPDFAAILAGVGPAELVELQRMVLARAEELAVFAEIVGAVEETAKGRKLAVRWQPTEPPPDGPPRAA